MDDADIAQMREELASEHAKKLTPRKPEGPLPNGRCHYCDELVADSQRWCDVHCRDAYEREVTAKRA